MSIDTYMWLIPAAPLVAFGLIVLFTNRNKALSHWVALAGAGIAWLASMLLFIAAVLMAQFAGVDHALITRLALAFIACRALHGVFYLASIPVMRSFVWFGGIGCVLALMAQAALKAGG